MVTHWDDQSDEAREIGASLIRHRANYEAITTKRVKFLFANTSHHKIFISLLFLNTISPSSSLVTSILLQSI